MKVSSHVQSIISFEIICGIDIHLIRSNTWLFKKAFDRVNQNKLLETLAVYSAIYGQYRYTKFKCS